MAVSEGHNAPAHCPANTSGSRPASFRDTDLSVVTIEGGRIISLENGPTNGSTETLTPAFFDLHISAYAPAISWWRPLGEIAVVGRFLNPARMLDWSIRLC